MTIELIAAIIIFALLLVFIVIVLNSMRLATGRKIHNDINRMLSIYDRLLEKKSIKLDRIKRLRNEIQRDELPEKSYSGGEKKQQLNTELPYTILDTRYRTIDYARVYKKIRQEFTFDKVTVLKEILERVSQERTASQYEMCRAAERILVHVKFEGWFRLSILKPEEQEKVLLDYLGNDGYMLTIFKAVSTFGDGSEEEFDCFRFKEWLREYMEINSDVVTVKTSEINADYSGEIGKAFIEYDKNVCEGFIIYAGNKIYDYGVLDSELG